MKHFRHLLLHITAVAALSLSATAQLTTARSAKTYCNPIIDRYWTNFTGYFSQSIQSNPALGARPDGWDYLERFQLKPLKPGQRFGERIRGYVHPPVTGLYVARARPRAGNHPGRVPFSISNQVNERQAMKTHFKFESVDNQDTFPPAETHQLHPRANPDYVHSNALGGIDQPPALRAGSRIPPATNRLLMPYVPVGHAFRCPADRGWEYGTIKFRPTVFCRTVVRE